MGHFLAQIKILYDRGSDFLMKMHVMIVVRCTCFPSCRNVFFLYVLYERVESSWRQLGQTPITLSTSQLHFTTVENGSLLHLVETSPFYLRPNIKIPLNLFSDIIIQNNNDGVSAAIPKYHFLFLLSPLPCFANTHISYKRSEWLIPHPGNCPPYVGWVLPEVGVCTRLSMAHEGTESFDN